MKKSILLAVYVTAFLFFGFNLAGFGQPGVITTDATAIAQHSVILNGTVNANSASTTVTFEYGLTASYGSIVNVVTGSPVSGSVAKEVSASVSGLLSNTTYHFRVAGVNVDGSVNGSDLTFTTLAAAPVVTTTAATAVAQYSATLNGTVVANNSSTTVTFEYGPTTAYGSIVTVVTGSPVSGSAVTNVAATISGLLPNSTYHFRAVGVNAGGITRGGDQVFTVLASVVAPTIQASNITFSNVTGTGMTVSWTNGNGAKRIVYITAGLTFINPVDGTDPVANVNYFGSEEQQVVYNGNGNSVTVVLPYTGYTYYSFKVFEYNGTGSSTRYCTTGGTNNSAYLEVGTLCGTKTVGAGAGNDFATLTEALAAVNTRALCGALNLILTDPAYPNEIFPININHNLGSSFTSTITIKPAAGVSPVITCNTAEDVFLVDGSDYLIIDGSNQTGGSSKNLTINNTYTGGGTFNSVFNFTNGARGATNTTIKNCIIKGNSSVSYSYGVYLNPEGGNVYNTSIVNNSIKDAAIGILLAGATGKPTSNSVISGNIIGDNTEPLKRGGIAVYYCDNTLITGNEILGEAAGNSNGAQYGIYIGTGTTNSKIRKNRIHDFYYNGSDATGCYGIFYKADANSLTEISNNLIYNIKSDGDKVSNGAVGVEWIPSGISIISGGNLQIYHNTINMTGNVLGTGASSSFAGSSACLVMNAGVTNVNVRNNIFKNSMATASGTGASNTYGVVSYAANTAFTDIDFNDYYIDGINPKIGYLSGDILTLANWQTATTKDAHSISASPGFVSATDLHPALSGPNNKGIALSGITTDFAEVTRLSPPDMGAYEYSMLATVITGAASGITTSAAMLNGSVNANNESAAVAFAYGPTVAYGTTVVATPGPVTGSSNVAVSSSLTGLLPNTTYHFRVNATTNAGLAHGNDQTFTTNALAATIVTNTATNVGINSAQLNGTVNANYASTTVTFEMGLTTAYGTPVNPTNAIVTGGAVTAVLANKTGLAPNTTYHYRCVGVNAAGTTYGNDQIFSTPCSVPTPILTGASTACINAAGTVYTTETGMHGYSWTVSAGGTITAGGTATDHTATIVWNTAGAQTVRVNYANAYNCTATTATVYAVTVNALPAAIAGTDRAICSGSGTTLGAAAVSGSTYSWISVPAGFTSTIANPIVSPTINTTYKVVETITATGCNNTHSVVVTVNSIPAAVAGTDRVICSGTGTTLGTAAVTGSSYSWTSVPAGFTSSLANPQVNPMINTTYKLVETTTASGCTNTHNVVVTAKAVPVPEITGPADPCAGSAGNSYATTAGMTSYVWTVSAGGTITSGTGTNTIAVTWNTAGAQSVSVSYTNAGNCPADAPTLYNVTVNPIPAAPVITLSGYTLTSNATSGNQWYKGGVLIPGETSATYTAPHTGAYASIVTQAGCSSAASNSLKVDYVGINTISAGEFELYPVPSNGLFTAALAWLKAELFTLRVYNDVGTLMFEKKDLQVDGSARQMIDLSTAPGGMYTVTFTSGLHQVVRKMIIIRP